MEAQNAKKKLLGAIIGTVLVALCCFTPLLIVGLSALGLALLIPYLDYVLLPALLVMGLLTVVAYRKWKQASVK